MPHIGETVRRCDIGLRGRQPLIWTACPECGQERWAQRVGAYCRSCNGKQARSHLTFWNDEQHRDDCKCTRCHMKDQRGDKNPGWRGGKRMHQSGYQYVLVTDDDPLRCMGARDGYVLEHRLVMARYLERPLLATETVHHRNGDRLDNRIENLELWITNHSHGIRADDYHCPGCRCFENKEE